MECQHITLKSYVLFFLLLTTTTVRLENSKRKGNVCAYLHCDGDEVCVHRKFRCNDPPCPSMLYCAKSRTESLRGPSTCNTVHCTSGYVCVLKIRECSWDKVKCDQQIARCVSRKEYHEGPASCAGFKCPQGSHCILRESLCVNPPCKLLRSCAKNKDVHDWFGKCRSLGCPSEFECFLRRPENNCVRPPCKHTPDCMATEDETTSEHCRGWICPKMQKCSVQIIGDCKTENCDIERSCYEELSNYTRRPLNDEQGHLFSKTDTISGNRNQDDERKAKTPHSWLNHLNSKTELDAIELWIANAKEQKDFKQFQDWLRSVKDILGSRAYSRWVEEILSSRSEEFRKWLRASHIDTLEGEKPIFLDRERPRDQVPRALTENPYPDVPVTLNTLPPAESSRRKEEMNFLQNEKNLTKIIEKLLVSNRILEAALLNTLKHPLYSEEADLSSLLQKNKNVYEQPYFVLPVANVKVTGDSMLDDRTSKSHGDFQGQNGQVSKEENSYPISYSGSQENSSLAEEKLSSLWAKLYNDFGHRSAQTDRHDAESPAYHFPDGVKMVDKPQYFDEIPVDALEKLIESLQFPTIGNSHHTFNEGLMESYEQSTLPILRNTEHNGNRYQDTDHGETFGNRNSNGTSTFSAYADEYERFPNHFGTNVLSDKSGQLQPPTDSDQLIKIRTPESMLQEIADGRDDAMDLNLFLKLNKETLLPYIQSLMDVVNEENISTINVEPNPEESSMKQSFLQDNNSRDANESSSKSSHLQVTQTSVVSDDESYNLTDTYDSEILIHEPYEDTPRSELDEVLSDTSDKEQRNGSRTTGLIYTNQELTNVALYNPPPSYGSSDMADIGDGDYWSESNGTDRIDSDSLKSVAN